jgi:hypothetical protein
VEIASSLQTTIPIFQQLWTALSHIKVKQQAAEHQQWAKICRKSHQTYHTDRLRPNGHHSLPNWKRRKEIGSQRGVRCVERHLAQQWSLFIVHWSCSIEVKMCLFDVIIAWQQQ